MTFTECWMDATEKKATTNSGRLARSVAQPESYLFAGPITIGFTQLIDFHFLETF